MRWSLADLHLHTTCSDGMHTPEQLAARLARSRLAVAAVTDHDTISGALRVEAALDGEGPEIVIGSEVSTRDGHVLALFVTRDLPVGLSAADTVDAIHAEGGVAVAAHPFSFAFGVGDMAASLPFDGVEVVNGSPFMEIGNARTAARCSGRRTALVGGSDAHVAAAAGHVCTRFPGSGAADLRAAILARQTRPVVDWPGRLAALPLHMAWLLWVTARSSAPAPA